MSNTIRTVSFLLIAFWVSPFAEGQEGSQNDDIAAFLRFHVEAAPGEAALVVNDPTRFEREVRLAPTPILTLLDVSRAFVNYSSREEAYDVRIELTSQGQEKLYRITSGMIGRSIGVFIDGKVTIVPRVDAVVRAPVVPVTTGTVVGGAERLVDEINGRIRQLNP